MSSHLYLLTKKEGLENVLLVDRGLSRHTAPFQWCTIQAVYEL